MEQGLRRVTSDGPHSSATVWSSSVPTAVISGLPSPAKTLLGWSKVMMAWSPGSLWMTTRSGA